MPESTKPAVMLYDGECAFCRGWVARWRSVTGAGVRYAPYQEEGWHYPQVTERQCEEAVQLLLPDGAVFSGAHAVFKALAFSGKYAWLLRSYEKVPLFGPAAEFCYQVVAHHRVFFSKLPG